MKKVTITGGNILYGAFYGCTKLTDITIPDKVTSIEGSAFYNCESLTSIKMPTNVTKIEKSAFEGCKSLASITIPNNVKSIGEKTFYGCGLTSLNIPNSVTSIGKSAFQNCEKIKDVTIGNGVKTIENSAFEGCKSLASITIPNNVNSIGESLCKDCVNLRYVTIGNGVTDIKENSFNGCSSLLSVTIGTKVAYFYGYSAFAGCVRLVEIINKSSLNITLGGGTSYGWIANWALNVKKSGESDIDSIDGYLFYTYYNVNYLVGYEGSETSLTLPDKYNGQNYEIYNCDSLTSVIIPNSVTSIGDYAFDGCSSLTSITIPNKVTSIGDHAFSTCSSLTSVTIPDSVTSIGDHAFSTCSSLTSVTIPNGVKSIGNRAFYECTALTEIKYNATECADLSDLNWVFTNAGISGTGIKVTIGKNVKKIPASLFYTFDSTKCTPPKITEVVFEEGSACVSIGKNAFNGCSALNSVSFGNSNGWYVCENADATSGTNLTLTDAEQNATYLKSTYYNYYWKRG